METRAQQHRKPHVLAVDDKPANLVVLEAALGDDYALSFASSGPEAIELLRGAAREVDLILMDIQMPGMDGFEATAQIKQLPGCEEIPVIFVTAVFRDDPWVRRGYEVGGVDYFAKPFDVEILRRKISIYAAYKLHAELVRTQTRHAGELRELAQVANTLWKLLDQVGVGVLVLDRRGRVRQSTAEVAGILGPAGPNGTGAYAEVLRWLDTSGERMSKDSAGPLACALYREAASRSKPLPLRIPDGTAKTVQVFVAPLHGHRGRVVGAAVTILDLTEVKITTREQLQQRVSRLITVA
jgi:CheY-like chemotaxis protein